MVQGVKIQKEQVGEGALPMLYQKINMFSLSPPSGAKKLGGAIFTPSLLTVEYLRSFYIDRVNIPHQPTIRRIRKTNFFSNSGVDSVKTGGWDPILVLHMLILSLLSGVHVRF